MYIKEKEHISDAITHIYKRRPSSQAPPPFFPLVHIISLRKADSGESSITRLSLALLIASAGEEKNKIIKKKRIRIAAMLAGPDAAGTKNGTEEMAHKSRQGKKKEEEEEKSPSHRSDLGEK